MMLNKLCPPALLYLGLSLLVLLVSVFQTTMSLTGLVIYALVSLLFITFWTWILNLICNAGYKWVSWVLVLVPLVLSLLLFFIDLRIIYKSMKMTPTPTFFTNTAY